MPLKILNWKLALLALAGFILFIYLGTWQLSRANQKKILLKSFTERTLRPAFSAAEIANPGDLRFYQAYLLGSFDNAHTVLLDNKIYQGKVGYEIYTPFKAIGLAQPILVNRGFIPIGQNRKTLPTIRAISGQITITGMLNLPPTYVVLKKEITPLKPSWPLRLEYIHLNELSTKLGYSLYPYVLSISPKNQAAYEIKWQAVTMAPEKHIGYAIQWFAFALTLLILFVALNRPKKNHT